MALESFLLSRVQNTPLSFWFSPRTFWYMVPLCQLNIKKLTTTNFSCCSVSSIVAYLRTVHLSQMLILKGGFNKTHQLAIIEFGTLLNDILSGPTGIISVEERSVGSALFENFYQYERHLSSWLERPISWEFILHVDIISINRLTFLNYFWWSYLLFFEINIEPHIHRKWYRKGPPY